MKLTNIRCAVTGKKLNKVEMTMVADALENRLAMYGFITESYVVNSSRIDLKTQGKSFTVNTKKLGYNANIGHYNGYGNYYSPSTKSGYRRTNIPTWDQRVEYNNLVNSLLDTFKVSCNIKSGYFVVRQGADSFTETDWAKAVPRDEWSYTVERIVPLSKVEVAA